MSPYPWPFLLPPSDIATLYNHLIISNISFQTCFSLQGPVGLLKLYLNQLDKQALFNFHSFFRASFWFRSQWHWAVPRKTHTPERIHCVHPKMQCFQWYIWFWYSCGSLVTERHTWNVKLGWILLNKAHSNNGPFLDPKVLFLWHISVHIDKINFILPNFQLIQRMRFWVVHVLYLCTGHFYITLYFSYQHKNLRMWKSFQRKMRGWGYES